jgi:hypothetical protein
MAICTDKANLYKDFVNYLVGLWQKFFTGSWQYSHQLLKRQEGSTDIKRDIHVLEVLDITNEGSIMMRIKPEEICNE